MSYIVELQKLYEWLNTEAYDLEKHEIIDTVKVRTMDLIQSVVAFPHCESFSLLAETPAAPRPA